MASPVETWLWLLMVMQPHNYKTTYILSQFGGDAKKAARSILEGQFDFLTTAEKNRAKNTHVKEVQEVVEVCKKNNVRIITIDSEEYPSLLRAIRNPPIVLFVKGSLEGLNNVPSIAAVGTRHPDEYSIRVAKSVCRELALVKFVIVSGVAVGLDAAAHQACIDAGGRTIAVLGCGILVDYPAENKELKENILKSGGALVSELLPYTNVSGSYFKYRNRIISGLTLGTLVLEASPKSGSLLTAGHAVDQGRDVFFIPPHDILTKQFGGAETLWREGAVPVFSYIDIFREICQNRDVAAYISEILEKSSHRTLPKPKAVNSENDVIEEPKPKTRYPQPTPPPAPSIDDVLSQLSPMQKDLYTLIHKSPATVDEIIDKTEYSFDEVVDCLMEMEIGGYIEREMDGNYQTVDKVPSALSE